MLIPFPFQSPKSEQLSDVQVKAIPRNHVSANLDVRMPKVSTRSMGARANRKGKSKQKEDFELTVAEWKKLSTEVLRLKCQDLNLITTGRSADLAQRLYDRFHPVELNPPVDIDLGDEEANQTENTISDDTLPYDDDEEEYDDPPFPQEEAQSGENNGENSTRNGANNMMEMIQTVVENSLQGWAEERQLMEAQVKALRSKIENMDRQQKELRTTSKTTTANSRMSANTNADKHTSSSSNANAKQTSTGTRSTRGGGHRERQNQNQGKSNTFFMDPEANIPVPKARNPFRVAAPDGQVHKYQPTFWPIVNICIFFLDPYIFLTAGN